MKKILLLLTPLAVFLSVASWLVYAKVKVAPLNQALCVAAAEGDTTGVELLLRRGANSNGVGFIPNPDGDCNDADLEGCGPSPPLFFAVTGSPGHHPDPMTTVDVLLRSGADVNAQPKNNYSETALMWATSPRLAKLLLAHGANSALRDHDGKTALMYAAQSNLGVVQALIATGADINARDNRGKTALGWALPSDDPQDSIELRHNAEVRRIADFLKKNGARQ